jgi:hypothetical protein
MANQAPITRAAPAATFDAAHWLSRFESVGGGFLATENQTSLCVACHGKTPQDQKIAHAMLRDLADDQRAAVVAHIRAGAGLFGVQPDLNAIPLERLSRMAGTEPPPSGDAPNQRKGPQHMDMTHSFTTSDETPGDANNLESLAGLEFEPVECLPAWSNKEWALANLPHVRLSAVIIGKTKNELHETVKGLIERELLEETLDALTETKGRLQAMIEVIDSALLRQFVILEELGFTPANPPAQAT